MPAIYPVDALHALIDVLVDLRQQTAALLVPERSVSDWQAASEQRVRRDWIADAEHWLEVVRVFAAGTVEEPRIRRAAASLLVAVNRMLRFTPRRHPLAPWNPETHNWDDP